MVYFITDGYYTKIGKANNPDSRLLELQTGNAKKLSIKLKINGGNEIESKLHKLFNRRRVSGEWFILDFEYDENSITDFLSFDFLEEKKYVYPTLQMKVDKSKNDVLDSIIKLNKNNIENTVSNISDDCKLSLVTVKKYVDVLDKELNVIKRYSIINKNEQLASQKDNELFEACLRLKDKGSKINKLRLSKETGISRITIDRHWDKIENFIKSI